MPTMRQCRSRRHESSRGPTSWREFNFGSKDLTLKDLQRFRGIATGWGVVAPGLKNELKSADVFMGGLDGAAKVRPKLTGRGDSTREEDSLWEDLWELFEDCRWLCARSETWSDKFGGSLKELLPPMERLSLPGGLGEGPVFVSSDATLDLIGAIDWTNGVVCREEVKHLAFWVKQVLEAEGLDGEGRLAIHVGEMLSFVAFACQVGFVWAGRVVIFGGDNKIVYHWVLSRRSGTRAGRLLIRVLNLVERRFRCRVLGCWWRTYHNEDADAITRLSDEEIEAKIREKGWKTVDIKPSIRQALLDTARFGACFLSWADEGDREEMMRLREIRVFRAVHRQPQQLANVEIEEWTVSERGVKDFEYYNLEGKKTVKVVAATLGPDPMGKALTKLTRHLETADCEAVVAEGPRDVMWEVLKRWATKSGWKVHQVEFLTTELGEAMVRRRIGLVLHKGSQNQETVEALLVRGVTSPSVGSVMGKADEGSWVPVHRLESAVNTQQAELHTLVGAHVWFSEDGERKNVYRVGGPVRWPLAKEQGRAMEEIYVLDKAAPVGMVRKMTGQEVWAAQGRKASEWVAAVKEIGEVEALKQGCRATGRHTALALLLVASELARPGVESEKAGMCRDVEDYKTLGQLVAWLRRWRRGDFQRAQPERKAGGIGNPRRGGGPTFLGRSCGFRR